MFYDEEDNVASLATYLIDYIDSENRVALEKIVIENGKVEECKKNYYVIKHVTGNLAKSENRTYSAKEDATKVYSKVEVILAFLLTDKLIPIIEP
jgi:SRSO17 transposase